MKLPPGQRARDDFPRFGLAQFVDRIPEPAPLSIVIGGDCEPFTLDGEQLARLERIEQVSDLHCVTTWSAVGLRWGGYRFSDVFRELIEPRTTERIAHLHLKCADGFRTRMLLEDALADDVLLADQLDGEPLSRLHGGPCRLVAPQHYGYKSSKYVVELAVTACALPWRSPTPLRFMEHPRARVELEERGTTLPGWLLRHLYRPLVASTVRDFQAAWERRDQSSASAKAESR